MSLRYRNRGLSNNHFLRQYVKMVHTGDPQGSFEGYRDPEIPGPWSESHPGASVIADKVDHNGPNANGDYTMSRPVYHYKVVTSSLRSSPTIRWDLPPYKGVTNFVVTGNAPFGNGAFFDERYCPPPPTEVVSRFAIQCIDEMATQFPPEQDFLSFVLELKSLTSLIDNLADIAQGLRDLAGRRINIRKAARIHAGYNFGVSPILSDTATLHGTFTRVQKRIKWLMEQNERWFRVGSRTSFSLDEETPVEQFGFSGYAPGVQAVRVHQRHVLTSTARVLNEIPDVSGWLRFVQGVIGDMGLNKPLTTFWEQIPFSWAVDYFIPVGQFLKQVTHSADPFWRVRDPSWSAKSSYGFRFPIGFESLKLGNLGTMTLSRYCRLVGLPPWEWYISDPSLKQLSLLAAVAVAEK